MPSDRHLRDEELMLLIDGEVSAAVSAAWLAHLRDCSSCRLHHQALTSALRHFLDGYQDSVTPSPPPEAALLRRRMAVQAHPSRRSIYMVPAAALFLLLAAGLWWGLPSRSFAGALPDSRLTPGYARALSKAEVCGITADDDTRAVPVELARRVFREYRIDRPRPRAYEMDYLISPALGGADDVRNLWPQPYNEGVWNSRVKDALEDHLREQVCDGSLELARVQSELARDWIAAYKSHFHTGEPLAAHRRFVKDLPWE